MAKTNSLKEYLFFNGITVNSFAEKTGLSRQTISGILNERVGTSFETAIIIWRATGYEVRLITLYPKLNKLLPDIKEIAKGC